MSTPRLLLGCLLCAMDIYDSKKVKPKKWTITKIILLSSSYYLFFKTEYRNKKHDKYDQKKQPIRNREMIAFLIATFAFLIKLYAQSLMKAQYKCGVKPDSNQKLVVGGPYSVVRHPGYCASYCHSIAATLFIDNWASYALTIARFIRAKDLPHLMDKEERNLQDLGLAYHNYKSKVPYRLIPYLY